MNTPCGLTQEQLDAHYWVDDEGECTAPFKNASGERQKGCGELYASHPSSAQGSSSSFPFFSITSALNLFLYISSHISIALDNLKLCYNSNLISPTTRLLLSVK